MMVSTDTDLLLARPPVVSATRLRENWFLVAAEFVFIDFGPFSCSLEAAGREGTRPKSATRDSKRTDITATLRLCRGIASLISGHRQRRHADRMSETFPGSIATGRAGGATFAKASSTPVATQQ